jgi:hypothetical protein
MAWPKGVPRKKKVDNEIKPEATEPEVKVEAPKKERKPRATKASKKDTDEKESVHSDAEEVLEIRKKLDANTLDPFETITNNQFECSFVSLTERLTPVEADSIIKDGRYSSSYYPIKNINHTVWPVLAYIKTDLDGLREKGYTDKEIYAGCINYLSSQTSGKKRKYGNLFPFSFTVKPDRIIATFITDDRKNKNFWGEGLGV